MASSGMSSTRQVVVDFKLMSGDAVKNIQDLNTKIANLQATMKSMEEAGMKNSKTYIELSAALKEMEQSVRANQKVLVEDIKQQKANADSINALRAQLKLARQEYEDLSAAERNSAEGDSLLQHINDLTDKLKDGERAQQDFSRSVGEYSMVLDKIPGGKVIQTMAGMSKGVGSLKGAFMNGLQGVKAFGAGLKALMKIPIVAIISAIALVIMKLVDSFKKNDAAMTMVKKTMAMLKVPLQILEKIFQALTKVLTAVMDALVKVAEAIMSLIPGVKDYVDANNDLIESQERLEDAERAYALNSAYRQKEVADLRYKAAEADQYTFKERKKFLQQALDLEYADYQEKEQLAKERLRVAEEEAALEMGYSEMTEEVYEEMNDEMKNNINELRVACVEAETEFLNTTRRIQKEMQGFIKQEQQEREREANERKQAAKQAAQEAKQRRKTQIETAKSLEEMFIKSLKNMYDREFSETMLAYRNQIAALKERLKTEENLTVQARKNINKQIKILNREYETDRKRLQFEFQRQLDMDNEAARKKMNEFRKSVAEDNEEGWLYSMRMDIAINESDAEILKEELSKPVREMTYMIADVKKDMEELTNSDIYNKYFDVFELRGLDTSMENAQDSLKQLLDIYTFDLEIAGSRFREAVHHINEATKKENERLQNEYTKKVHDEGVKRLDLERKHAEILRSIQEAEIYDPYAQNEIAKTELLKQQAEERLEVAKDEYKRLAEEREKYNDEELKTIYGSVEEYNNLLLESELKVIEAENGVKDAIKDVADATLRQKQKMIETATAIMSAMESVAGSMQSLFEQLAESDDKYSNYATAMAMMQIMISTAISIANAIQGATAAAAATGPGAPIATPVFIAEMVAIVAGALASATTTLLKAKQEKPSAPKFAHGGLVGNHTTRRRDDTVDAKLTLGEFIVPAPVVDDYGVDFFNKIVENKGIKSITGTVSYASGGLVQALRTPDLNIASSIDYDVMREVMAEAVSEVKPVVSVKEITATQNRVAVKERIAKE